MLSILIPVYNYDVRMLVSLLNQQCTDACIPFEIIVMDDGSDQEIIQLHKEIRSFPAVKFIVNEKNTGRAAIRNRLTREASYNWLLFLDCDGMPVTNHYISTYLAYSKTRQGVICGGRIYPEQQPKADRILHWLYGKKNESKPATIRQIKPYRSFMTSNFMIEKGILIKYPFDESITGYGHEDTVFGLQIKQLGVPVIHINNPVIHNQLEPAAVFLSKSAQAVQNLAMLTIKYPALKNEVTLLRWYFGFFRFIARPVAVLAVKTEPVIITLLSGAHPWLWLFPVFKLGCLKKTLRDRPAL